MNNNEDENENFEDIFDLTPVKLDEIIVYDAPTDNADSYDIEAARQNIHHLLQKGTVALDELIQLSRSSQDIKGFEAVTKLITTLSNVNKDLVDIQEKKKRLKVADDKPATKADKIVQNNLYVGSTEDFAKVIEEMEKKNG